MLSSPRSLSAPAPTANDQMSQKMIVPATTPMVTSIPGRFGAHAAAEYMLRKKATSRISWPPTIGIIIDTAMNATYATTADVQG
ncbi:hypothetical protein MAJHIDBO_01136 [Propionibacterium freudenreichii subsp. shermanii]|nr:hypothetical protein MAJHIDBO_01136 [Propionibacterium freudenreichii subsp. shermanii]SPS08931.1 hypothetical protein MAJHIDBO_01136 [Propionibacterium freudenreichii subsp. shermanii]